MSPVAQENTNVLLEELFCYVRNREAIDPFTKARMLREASKQTTFDRQYTLEAYIYTIAKERDLAKDSALKALRCVDDPATISSCFSILQLNAFPASAIEQAKQMQNYLDSPEYLMSFSSFFTVYPDVILMERAMTKMESMDLLSSSNELSDLYKYFSSACKTINSSAKELEVDKSLCSRIIVLASSLLEQSHIVLNQVSIEKQNESDWLSIILNVETENTRQLAELNWALVSELIDAELNHPNIVTRFEMVQPSEKIARVRYVS